MANRQIKSKSKPVAAAVAEVAKPKRVNTNKGPKTGRAQAAPAAKGAYGAALAMTFIKRAEEIGQQDLKREGSYKDQLRELERANREDHLEFRGTLKAKVDEYKAEADKVKLSLTKWMEADTVRRSVYNLCGMWDRMSRACEAGYRPNYDKSWSEISKGASDKLAAQAAAAAQAKVNEEIKAIEQDTTLPDDVKEAKIKVVRFQTKAEAAGPTAHKSAKGRGRPRKEVILWDEVLNLIKDRPIHETEKLTGQLMFYLAQKLNKSVDTIAKLIIEDMKKKPAPASEKSGMAGEPATA